MNILFLWSNIPFGKNCVAAKKVLRYYLLEKNVGNRQFEVYHSLSDNAILVELSPEKILDKDVFRCFGLVRIRLLLEHLLQFLLIF